MCKTPITHNQREQGSVIIIVMAMIMVFMALGLALFYLAQAQTGGTELERRNITSFNVAEAGLDAGMLKLKGAWPKAAQTTAVTVAASALPVTVDASDLQTRFTSVTNTQGVAQISVSAQGRDLITVKIYDNSTVASTDAAYVADTYKGNNYTTLEDGTIHPNWDKGGPSASTANNPDGIMVVDSRSDVNKDRKRILIQATRMNLQLGLPNVAVAASRLVGSPNGTNNAGFSVGPDTDLYGNIVGQANGPGKAIYGGTDDKGVSTTNASYVPLNKIQPPEVFNFPAYVDAQLINDLTGMANAPGNLYTHSANDAGAFLTDTSKSPGAVVFADLRGKTKSESTIKIGGGPNTPVGSPARPTILVLQGDSGQLLQFSGGKDFYGLLIVIGGSATNTGATTFHGSVLCEGTLTGKGGGSIDVQYNGDIIQRLNDGYILNASLNVTLVPNTWVEY